MEAKVLAKNPGNNQFGQEVKYIVEVLKNYKVCLLNVKEFMIKINFSIAMTYSNSN